MTLNLTDVILIILLLGSFVLGYFQGAIRQMLGLLAWLFAFLLAANLRAPLGEWFSRYWTDLPTGYSRMLAFGIAFIVLLIAANVAIELLYKRISLTRRWSVLDELVGGALGAVLFLLILSTFVIILDSFYRVGGLGGNDVRWIREIYVAFTTSNFIATLKVAFIPALVGIFGFFLPSEVRDALSR